MSVAVLCSSCSRGSRIAEELVGKNVQCPYCFDVFEAVRDPDAAPPPEPPPARAAALVEPVVAEVVPNGEAAAPPPTPIVPPEEILTVEAVPTPTVKPFRPIRFVALITRDPDGALKGRMLAEVNADGLRLSRQEGRLSVLSPVGNAARHLGQNRLAVTVQGREVQMLVFKANARQERLARDIAAFLNGRRPSLNPHDYSAVWYLVVAALLPLGLPLLGIPLNLMNGAAGVALWLALGLGLAGAGLFLGLRSWHPGARFASIAGLVGAGYLFLFLAPPLGLAAPPRIEHWRTFTAPDGSFTLQMPTQTASGYWTPRADSAFYGNLGYTVYTSDLPYHQAAFSAACIDLNAAGVQVPDAAQLFDERMGDVVNRNNLSRGAVVSQKNFSYLNRYPAREFVLRGGRVNGTLTVRLILVSPKLFILSAAGADARAQERDARTFFESFTSPQAVQPRSPADLPGLLFYLPFEEGNGSNLAVDPQNRFRTANLINMGHVDGVRGKAVQFNGPNHRVDYDRVDGLQFPARGAFTFAGWLRTQGHQGTVLAQRRNGFPDVKFQVTLWNGALRVVLHTDNVGLDQPVILNGNRVVGDGRWHHFAVTRSSDGDLELFVDGLTQGSNRSLTSRDALTTDVRSLGCERVEANNAPWDPAHSYQGDLDEFCVYNRVLSLPEIQSLAGAGP
jgi:hypothetical protein